MTAPHPFALIRHPATPCTAVHGLHAGWRWHTQGSATRLHLRYTLHADLRALRLPPARSPRLADGLWRHTCFEAFVGMPSDDGYHEFNFAPSGEWAAYGFQAERQRDPIVDDRLARLGLMPARRQDGEVLTLDVSLPLAALPRRVAGAPWRLGLTAVIETRDGRLSYWALRHPAAQPDFHHPGGWIASVCAPASEPA